MSELGFVLPTMAVNIPASERVTKTANDILNKYSVHSMENELRWAFSDPGFKSEDFFLNAGEGKWHDAQMVPNLVPGSLARCIERRNIVADLMRQVPQCRIIVITLGLAEAWFDTKLGIYLNGMPPQTAINDERNRFRLDILDCNEIVASLESIHEILSMCGHPDFKILITVSPVPFKASFSGKDALTANTYSKCAQRAAAEIFVASHPNVNYFPSYEIVTLSDRKTAYELDNIHVTHATVAKIMQTVVDAYASGVNSDAIKNEVIGVAHSRTIASTKNTLMARGKEAMATRDYDAAVTEFSSMLFRFTPKMSAEEQFEARLNLGVAMLRAKLTVEGVKQLEFAKTLSPGHPRATYKLGLGYARVKMNNEALEMYYSAVQLNPGERDYHWRLGVQLIRMGKVVDRLVSVRAALDIDPNHIDSLEIVAKYS